MPDLRSVLPSTVADLLAAARGGSARAAGRLLTQVEGDGRSAVLDAIGPPTGSISVIGITGPPGAGKSTTITALVAAYRSRGRRVAVLAVDPTSPYSGGALLGDRIRMTQHIDDMDVLIRSMATRGHLGGLSSAVPAAIRLLEGLGYDVVFVETVGVGQSEVEVSAVADPAVVILNPGAGDAVQAAKAGLLEVADILVVNKADREGAQQTVRDLRMESSVPVMTLVATRGEGVDELIETIENHRREDDPDRRAARLRAQILSLAMTQLRTHPGLADAVDDVIAGRGDIYAAVETLINPAVRRVE